MIDCHSHILPEIDDGASSIEMSLKMLEISANSGVDTVVSTSHFYALDGHEVSDFLEKRDAAYLRVSNAVKETGINSPKIILGCEVHLSPGISKLKDFEKLAITGTDYILLEMPSSNWKDEIFEEIYQISRLGLNPIMAHIDRYFDMEKKFPDLFSLHPLFQVNADTFLDKRLRKKALELFSEDAIHIIGSDMHNLTFRPPNLAEAYAVIMQKFGKEYSDYLEFSSHCIVDNENPPIPLLPKLGFFKKMML